MCNEISRKTALDDLLREFEILSPPPRFEWEGGATPNDLAGKTSVRIRDSSPVFRLNGGTLVGSMIPWAWPGPKGAPVFNFRSEGRDFAHSDRVLVLADGFYEYTSPAAPKVKLKDQHYFTRAEGGWFWIAGLVKEGCFSLLTTQPGPDVAPYHDRQIVTLPPQAGLDWLTLAQPQTELLRAEPAGTFKVETLRRDGVVLADSLF